MPLSRLLRVACILLAVIPAAARAQVKNIDVMSTDGAALKATYYSPGRSGPGVLLMHQCNMTRTAWVSLGEALRARGVHVLAMEYRGYGDNRVVPADYAKLPRDVDAALSTLKAQPGVDSTRLAAGGASCGVDHAVQLARRNSGIKALVLLSGATTETGLSFIQQANLPVFLSYSADEGGPLPRMNESIATTRNPATVVRIFQNAGHGVPMFTAQPTLLPQLADWLAKVLR
jgi:dienelactone hydrolase